MNTTIDLNNYINYVKTNVLFNKDSYCSDAASFLKKELISLLLDKEHYFSISSMLSHLIIKKCEEEAGLNVIRKMDEIIESEIKSR